MLHYGWFARDQRNFLPVTFRTTFLGIVEHLPNRYIESVLELLGQRLCVCVCVIIWKEFVQRLSRPSRGTSPEIV
jgi:hypothetical protein